MGFWPVVKKVLKDADIVLEILDARMPEFSRNFELEELAQRYRRELILVVNKIDLVSQKYLNLLREEYPSAVFVSGTNNIGIAGLKKKVYILASRMKIKEPKIGVTGYPNTGKSAIINALSKSAKTKVSSVAGTTKHIQWVNASGLHVLDSPGVVPFEDNEVKLGILGAKNPEKLKNPEKVAFEIIARLRAYDKNVLEEKYGIEAKGDEYEILTAIGKKKGFLVKGGKIDENRAVYQVIRDWQNGQIKL